MREYRRLSKSFPKFGPFEFDAARSLLFRDGTPVVLGQRGTALLAKLLERRGDVLGKDELIEAAWPGLAVEDANLSVQISQLRRALGRTANGGEWIITVQRAGYRFVPHADPAAKALNMPVLAVLPFTDFDTGAQPEADGFVEDLTTALSQWKSILVVARLSSFQSRGREGDIVAFASQLGADYVLEGSRRKHGDGVRTNIQLIDGVTGWHLWAETFDQSAQSTDPAGRLVHRVAARVEPQIQRAESIRSHLERPESDDPYDLFLRGRDKVRFATDAENAVGYQLLKRALQKAPDDTRIIAACAGALHHRISMGWLPFGDDDRPVSLALAVRGAEVARSDGVALGTFANAMYTAREHDTARATMDRALEVAPHSPVVLQCTALGNLFLGENDRAEHFYESAITMGACEETLSFSLGSLATVHRRRGNYEAAIHYASRAVAVGRGYSTSHWNLIASSIRLGRKEDAHRYLARFRALSPTTTVASIRGGQPVVDERLIEPLLDALAEAGLPEA